MKIKKFSFGTAVLAALVFGFMFAGCEDALGGIHNPFNGPKRTPVNGASELAAAFHDKDVEYIEIQKTIDARDSGLSVEAGGKKTIFIPAGVETNIASLELEKGSHVTIECPTPHSAGTGPGVLVIWDHFRIAEGATFELKGWVEMVFLSAVTRENAVVDGTLKAEDLNSVFWRSDTETTGGHGFDGNGKVQTGDNDEKNVTEVSLNGQPYTFKVQAEETDPEETAPEETDPEETDPEETDPEETTGGIVKVNFTGLHKDENITLSGLDAPLSWSANTAFTVSVSESFTAYRWDLDGETLSGQNGNSLTLNAGTLAAKRHTLTVFVTNSGGVTYAKAVTFTVQYL